MQNKTDWNKISKMLVIRRLKKLISDWWNIQLNITDHLGYLQCVVEGKFFNPLNDICKIITADNKSFIGCKKTAKDTSLHSMKNSRLLKCHVGFSTISVPIKIKGKYIGCVFADGFLIKDSYQNQRKCIEKYMKENFSKYSNIKKKIQELPILTDRDIKYLGHLIKLVVDEIIIMYQDIENKKKELSIIKDKIEKNKFLDIIGKSRPMLKVYDLIKTISKSDATIYIQGDNGTGKELVAKAIHEKSDRKNNRFVAVNCGAFNDNLLESELFGHIKGSFTGAINDKKGVFEYANNGTLFLDEIGDTSLHMQVKLLRVIQTRYFSPLGSNEEKKLNIRIIVATNKNLFQMVKDLTFREDLYYRLNVLNIQVPALKERKEDIPLLVEYFISKFTNIKKTKNKIISNKCLKAMMNYDWPGNVRELENEIEKLCILSGDDEIINDDLLSPKINSNFKKFSTLKSAIESIEKDLIIEGLERTKWNKSKLAKELGISRAGLIAKVEKYKLAKKNIA